MRPERLEQENNLEMIVLRVFLYLICITCITWSGLVFAGPSLIKRLIIGYTHGALTASDVSVSPRLVVNVGRLDYIFDSEFAGVKIEGFSRANQISWSVFGEKPFLVLKLGPTILKKYGTAENIAIQTASFKDMVWERVLISASITGFNISSLGKVEDLHFEGELSLGSSTLSNLDVEAHIFNSEGNNPSWSIDLFEAKLKKFVFNAPISEQLFHSTFSTDNVLVLEPNLRISNTSGKFTTSKYSGSLKIDLHDVFISDYGTSVESVKFDGQYDRENLLENVDIKLVNGVFNNLPAFSQIATKITTSDGEKYNAHLGGTFNEFKISNDDLFLGLLPAANFKIDAKLDRAVSALTAKSKINFISSNAEGIAGSGEIKLESNQLAGGECAVMDCKFTTFDLSYMINVSDEWLKWTAECEKNSCDLRALSHILSTSNTADIFMTLNEAGVLAPLSSLYLYQTITAGQKIVNGHELRFQF